MKYSILLLLGIALTRVGFSQQSEPKIPKISEIKKLPDDELAEKREGNYFTGVPDFNSDPINGIGYGIEGSFYMNGKKSDPLFAYTPYRQKLDIKLLNSTKQSKEFGLVWDVPYVWNTPWRLRAEMAYEINPNLLYFGNGSKTLDGLNYYPNNDSSQGRIDNAKYSAYEQNLVGKMSNYNGFTKKEGVLNVSLERSIWDGEGRWLVGYEFAKFTNTTYSNNGAYNSLLENDVRLGKIVGLGTAHISMFQVGFVYDTRNLETDPSNGYFMEITHENSNKLWGSGYTFNKTFMQFKGYHTILQKWFKRQIIAWRVGMGYTHGNAPFFEFADEWSSEGSIEGLGGHNTLRGFKQSRFMAPIMNMNNLEYRAFLFSGTLLKQHLAVSAVPFFDFGGIWDNFQSFNLKNHFRYNEGLGLRLAWNVNTILRFDYGISKEDGQFFFEFDHAF